MFVSIFVEPISHSHELLKSVPSVLTPLALVSLQEEFEGGNAKGGYPGGDGGAGGRGGPAGSVALLQLTPVRHVAAVLGDTDGA